MSEIDEIFKNGLSSAGFDYSEAYWNEVARELDKKKKKRRALVYFFSGVLIASAGLGTYLGFRNSSGTMDYGLQNYQPEWTSFGSNENAIALNSTSAAAMESANSTENKINTENSHQNKKSTHINDIVKSTIATTRTKKSIIKAPEETLVDTKGQLLLAEIAETQEEPEEDKSSINLGYSLDNPATSDPDVDLLFGQMKDHKMIPARNPDISTKTKGKNTLNPWWEYSLAGGVEYNAYKRKVIEQSQKGREKTLNSFGYAINFAAQKGHWGFRTGLGLLQLKETTNYLSVNKSFLLDTNYRMMNPNFGQTSGGSVIKLIRRQVDTTFMYDSFVKYPNSKVQFSYLRIPLIATYSIAFHQFMFCADAGINTSVLLGSRGEYAVKSNSDYEIQNTKTSNDISKVLLHTYTAIGMKYAISKSMKLYTGYGMYLPLNSLVKSYSQKASVGSFSLGIEMKL